MCDQASVRSFSIVEVMAVQWFPGHMHKARLEIESVLPKVDVVMEILDARIPYSSENPMLAELRGNKPCLKVLAKSDLADNDSTTRWLDYLQEDETIQARSVTTDDVPTIRRLKQVAAKMVPHREGRTMTAMIFGIPNVGKSTIINYLAGKKIAKTGNTPAVTKQQQRVNIGEGVILLDTPGVLWPNVQNVNSGYRLALLGSIKETAMDYAEIGFFAARYLLSHYPDRLMDRYRLDPLPESDLMAIEAIGRKRGCLGRSNRVDIDRASRILVTELRSGELGRLTLESPEMMEQEIRDTEAAIAEKAEKTAARDARRKQRFKDKQRARRDSKKNR